jgi:hypothetical protein
MENSYIVPIIAILVPVVALLITPFIAARVRARSSGSRPTVTSRCYECFESGNPDDCAAACSTSA